MGQKFDPPSWIWNGSEYISQGYILTQGQFFPSPGIIMLKNEIAIARYIKIDCTGHDNIALLMLGGETIEVPPYCSRMVKNYDSHELLVYRGLSHSVDASTTIKLFSGTNHKEEFVFYKYVR